MDKLLESIFERSLELDSTLNVKELEDKLIEFMSQMIWMDETGGEPTVILYQGDKYVVDFSKESPNRRSLCYDKDARLSRKTFPPKSSVLEVCYEQQVNLVDEKLYRYMQNIKPIDLKTSSWVVTPDRVRNNGGAIFCDCRYGIVFTYHNGANSYYGARGFRSFVKL